MPTRRFDFAEMDARFGGFGIVPSELNNAIVSSHYFLFEVDETKVHQHFLRYCLQQPWFLEQVEAKGSTNYAGIRPGQVLGYQIPLPPLNEQQQIVQRVEAAKRRLADIKSIRDKQEREIKNLLFSKYIDAIRDAAWKPMSIVAPVHRRQVEIDANRTYSELGVRSFARGLFEKPSFKGGDLTWQKPFWLKAGDLLLSNIKAWEGAVAVVPKKYDNWVGSHRYITCLPNDEEILVDFLFYFFTTHEGVEALNLASPGTADRNRTLNTKKLESILVPVPDKEIQRDFLRLKTKFEHLLESHLDMSRDLDEMLPSLLDKAFKGEL